MSISDIAEDYLFDQKDGMRKLTAWLLNEVMQVETANKIQAVTGGLKLLNSGGIKLSTCQSLTSKLRGCVDAGPGGIPHAARFIQPRIEHQRDRQKNRTQPRNG